MFLARYHHRVLATLRSSASGNLWSLGTVGVLVVMLTQLIIARGADRTYVRSVLATPALASLATGSPSTPTVLLLARLNDCSANLEALRHFNTMAAGGRVRVQVVVLDTHEDSSSLQTILGGTGIRFPIRGNADPGITRTLAGLGHVTPVAVILDGQRHVRSIAPMSELYGRDKVASILAYTSTLVDSIPRLALAVPKT